MRKPKLRVVRARIPSAGLLPPAGRAVVLIQCGACGQRLPMLIRARADDPLVQAGLVAEGDLILEQPKGWRWDGSVWRETSYHSRQRTESREVARLTGNPRAAARLAQNRYSRGPIEPNSLYWESSAVTGHILPTRIECPHCRNTVNEIDFP